MSESFTIRDLRLPDDKPAYVSFIDGLQSYEHAFEPNRRVDAAVAEDFFAVLMKCVAEQQGRVLIAEADGTPIGWAVFVIEQNALYVVEGERTCGQISELFVIQEKRGQGVGQALIEACEAEAKSRGLRSMMIGVLSANKRSVSVYIQAGYSPYSMKLRKYL